MVKYRLTCPECNASLIALYPEAALWERCPGCLKHIWDIYDMKMADAIREHQHGEHACMHLGNHQPN